MKSGFLCYAHRYYDFPVSIEEFEEMEWPGETNDSDILTLSEAEIAVSFRP
jgi:hypothetical protein